MTDRNNEIEDLEPIPFYFINSLSNWTELVNNIISEAKSLVPYLHERSANTLIGRLTHYCTQHNSCTSVWIIASRFFFPNKPFTTVKTISLASYTATRGRLQQHVSCIMNEIPDTSYSNRCLLSASIYSPNRHPTFASSSFFPHTSDGWCWQIEHVMVKWSLIVQNLRYRWIHRK